MSTVNGSIPSERYTPIDYSFTKSSTYAVCITSAVVGLLFIALSASGVFGSLKGIGGIAAMSGGTALCLMSALAGTIWLIYMCREPQNHLDVPIPDFLIAEFGQQESVDDTQHDKNGFCPIHQETLRGNFDGVKQFVTIGKVDVNLKDKKQHTPLHFAAFIGNAKMVQGLIEWGADVNAMDLKGVTPVSFAIQNDKRDIMKILFQHGAKGYDRIKSLIGIKEVDESNLGRTSLHWAAKWGDEEAVKELGIFRLPNTRDKNGQTALHLASEEGRLSVVRKLVEELHVDPSIADNTGRTALHWAARQGHHAVVRLLLEKKDPVDVNAVDGNKQTPLLLSLWWGKTETTEFLLNTAHTDVTVANDQNQTPLHVATQRGMASEVTMIIDKLNPDNKKTEINRIDKEGRTPLHWAAFRGDDKIVQSLLDNEADRTIRDISGKTAYELTTHKAVKALLEPDKS